MLNFEMFLNVLKTNPTTIDNYSPSVTIFSVGINTFIKMWDSGKLVIELPNSADVQRYTLTYDPCMDWMIYDEIKMVVHYDGSCYSKHNRTYFKKLSIKKPDYLSEKSLLEFTTLYEIIALDLKMANYGNENQI